MNHAVSHNSSVEVPVWRLGIWWFLASEIVVFGGLVVCYILYRFNHPEWGMEAGRTLLWVGSVNTVVLLTSSLTMILAHYSIVEKGDLALGRRYLGVTILLGLLFLCFKGYEYSHEIHAGLVPSRSLFWGFYYLMTGLHGLHVIGGLVANGVILGGLSQGRTPHRIESIGLYWHFVDVVWIFLFPLLYLASQGGAS
ncbi:MAG: cytochrome c oxidase subunit 3 [Deltaproteobacteria bacterium]|nr:cytochrome c oxidase subunit 3 [Deltaproteobacteria bacterium]MBI2501366.1 cytochrome c oxidase subunit 3 [Deltaproteobacteria bacterium]